MTAPTDRRPTPTIRARLARHRQVWVGGGLLTLVAAWAWVGPWLGPWDQSTVDLTAFGTGPSRSHWFGTNDIGQDLYQQVLVGLRQSLLIGLIAGPGATLMAAVVGAVAGLVGGWLDRLALISIDLLLVLPSFYILVLVSPALTRTGWPALALGLALLGWMVMARTVRAQTRSLRERGYVRSARLGGASVSWVVRRHLWPNLSSLLVVDAAVAVGLAVLGEATLSYFGLGVQLPDVSLGTLLAAGSPSVATRPWLFVFPAGVLVLTVTAVGLLGNAVRDVLAAGGSRA